MIKQKGIFVLSILLIVVIMVVGCDNSSTINANAIGSDRELQTSDNLSDKVSFQNLEMEGVSFMWGEKIKNRLGRTTGVKIRARIELFNVASARLVTQYRYNPYHNYSEIPMTRDWTPGAVNSYEYEAIVPIPRSNYNPYLEIMLKYQVRKHDGRIVTFTDGPFKVNSNYRIFNLDRKFAIEFASFSIDTSTGRDKISVGAIGLADQVIEAHLYDGNTYVTSFRLYERGVLVQPDLGGLSGYNRYYLLSSGRRVTNPLVIFENIRGTNVVDDNFGIKYQLHNPPTWRD